MIRGILQQAIKRAVLFNPMIHFQALELKTYQKDEETLPRANTEFIASNAGNDMTEEAPPPFTLPDVYKFRSPRSI